MHEALIQLLWFVPWCWAVNISLNLLGYAKQRYPALERFDRAFDGGRRFIDGNRLLGESTTWLGFLLVLLLGVGGEALFAGHHVFLIAVLTFFGHALGSFIKRRLRMPGGAYLPIIDHADYVFCVGFVFLLYGYLSVQALSLALILTLILTPGVTLAAFRLGLRTRKL